jgi:preprotein translocase subunit YajC
MKGMTKMTNFLPLVADGAPGGGNQSSSMIFMVLFYVAIFAALYFFLIRPNSKKKKEEAQLRNSLEIGDEITTIGGIMGRVVAIKDDEDAIIIETGSDRVKMKFKKWCISTVDTVKEQPQQAGQPEKKGFFGFGKKKDSDEAKTTKE